MHGNVFVVCLEAVDLYKEPLSVPVFLSNHQRSSIFFRSDHDLTLLTTNLRNNPIIMKSIVFVFVSLFAASFVSAMPTPNPAFGCSSIFGGCRRPGVPSKTTSKSAPAPIDINSSSSSSAKTENGFRPVI
ncbi:hypothetical protein AB1N83_013792 [Pleurotus pulmonarius]|nr:hypothetical protein EYR38_001499 [Pleurotus pulmonarius]